jgi:hypothetical protein
MRDSNSQQGFGRPTCYHYTNSAFEDDQLPRHLPVGIIRLELITFHVSGEYSNQLSYTPIVSNSFFNSLFKIVFNNLFLSTPVQ